MEKIRFNLGLLLAAAVLFGCAQNSKKSQEDPMAGLLHISDGRAYLEKSDHKLINERRGAASEKWSSFVYFMPSQSQLPGTVWASENSDFEAQPGATTACDIKISKSHYEKESQKKNPTVLVNIRVKDGLSGAPFDTVINGESEGELQFGSYPLKNWKAIENLTLDETFIKEWSYNKKDKLYKIVKKMGENQYLKKEIKMGPQVRGISSVKYEILREVYDQDNKPQMEPLAKLHCGQGS